MAGWEYVYKFIMYATQNNFHINQYNPKDPF